MYKKNFGYLIRKSRQEKHLTIERLAEYCEVSERCVSNIERGLSEPKLGTALKLCSCCGIDIGSLLAICYEESEANENEE